MSRFPSSLAHRILERLPVPVLLARRDRVLAANAAARDLLTADARPGRRLSLLARLQAEKRARTHIPGPRPRLMMAESTPLGGGLHAVTLQPIGGDQSAATSDLMEALRSAREVAQSQRDFVSTLNHELKTPLFIIDANAQRMLRQLDPDGPLGEKATEIRTSVKNMTALLNSSLSAERMSPDSFQLTRQHQSLSELIRHATQRLQDGEPDSVKIRTHLPADADPPSAHIDATWMLHVVNNLVENAIKYSPGKADINVHYKLDPRHHVIEVLDEGIGLPEGGGGQMFDKFARGSNTRSIPGTGLGLYLVRMIVEQHGGRVYLEPRSDVARGTRAIVRLPR